jgi:surfeit locus 1 family protein
LHDKELHMAGRYVRGVLGYLVLTPLEMADGRKLLVNRGFVPAHLKEPDSRPESLPPGQVRVVGLVRKDNNRNYFTPDNAPEKNIWFTREHKVMGEQIEETLLPITIDQLRGTGIGEYPEPVGGEITLRNDHLGYAITWFLIGITGIIMFLVYYAEPKKAEDA